MNKKFTDMKPEDATFAEKLTALSEQTNPEPRFANELERQLKAAHKPKTVWLKAPGNSILPSLGWVALVVMAGLALIWTIQNLIPKTQPGTDPTEGFICPVTQPNGDTPPQEQPSAYHFGNGEIWTDLWPDGRVYMTPDNREPDGSYSMKWVWWRNATGSLDIEGHRLDADSKPMGVFYTGGYDDAGVYVVALNFPSPGCWEVSARTSDASLTFITEVFFGNVTPVPDLTTMTSTPAPENAGYDWRNTKLYLSVPLPQSPVSANLFTVEDEQPATLETAKALAAQFDLLGEIYETPSTLPGAKGYLVTDGRQRLYVQSAINFAYYTDYPSYTISSGGKELTDEQAASAIDDFLRLHGLDFAYRIENPHLVPGMYYILPLLPDGLRLQFDYNMPMRIEATIDEDGQVILFASYRASYDALDGVYGVISAEEAFQLVLNSSDIIQNGVLESMRSASGSIDSSFWSRTYPDSQTVTIYGQPQTYPSSSPGSAPFISIGQFTAVGNVAGIENVDYTLYIEATGQFVTENGIRRFVVDSWKVTTAAETYLSGSLRREGDQTLLTADDGSGEIIVEAVPADVPLNTVIGTDYLSIHGFTADGKFNWDFIQFYPGNGTGGGGGGGGGLGFYQLNLSGTPVPFPTAGAAPQSEPTPQSSGAQEGSPYTVAEGDTCRSIASMFNISVEELIAANNFPSDCSTLTIDQTILIPYIDAMPLERWEGQRGYLNITIYEKEDGSQRIQYGFLVDNPDFPYLLLEGDGLETLQKYNGHPVDVWGTVGNLNENGMPLLNVESFEVPFPDLQFQILKGTQQTEEVEGQPAILFTSENGNTYIELGTSCTYPLNPEAMVGQSGDPILIETLPVPGLTFGGYPAVCVYSSVMAVNPKTNQPTELTITANQPSILPEPPSAEAGNLSTATIENVELVYYVPNPLYASQEPNRGTQYIQPAWRFYGHYSNGDEFEFLVQALKPEFLLPELVPNQPPG